MPQKPLHCHKMCYIAAKTATLPQNALHRRKKRYIAAKSATLPQNTAIQYNTLPQKKVTLPQIKIYVATNTSKFKGLTEQTGTPVRFFVVSMRCVHIYIYIYIRTSAHAQAHACKHTHTHTHASTRTRTRTHTHVSLRQRFFAAMIIMLPSQRHKRKRQRFLHRLCPLPAISQKPQ